MFRQVESVSVGESGLCVRAGSDPKNPDGLIQEILAGSSGLVWRRAFPERHLGGSERCSPATCGDVARPAPVTVREVAADRERVANQPHGIRAGLELHRDGIAVLLDQQCVRPPLRDDVYAYAGHAACSAL